MSKHVKQGNNSGLRSTGESAEMYQWQPSKWIQLAAVGAGLPFLAAAVIQTNSLVQDVSTRAMAAAGGANVVFDGRDAKLSGEIASQDALDAATKAVAGTYGVRTVDASGLKIAPPPPPPPPVVLAAPTVESITTAETKPVIKGTWPEGAAKTLEVTTAGKTYVLGKDPELTSSNGNWVLKPAAALPVGANDVTAKISDGDKAIAEAAAPGKVVIEAPKVVEAPKPAAVPPPKPLVAPTVTAITTNNAMPEIKGTYPVDAAKLMVAVGAMTYELGKNPELTVDNAGNWTLKPAAALPDGETKVVASVADMKGTMTVGSAPAAVVIDTKPPSPPSVTPTAPDSVWPYAITGKWDEAEGNHLAVDLNNKSYTLGKDKELISDGHGEFTFVPTDTLAPGKYSLNFTETDAVGNATKFSVADAIIVLPPAPPPPPPPPPAPELTAPTIDTMSSDSANPIIKGTWQAGVAKSLTVDVGGVSHKLGTDYDLLTDSAGHWTLKPKVALANGTYDVVATVTDGAAKSMTDATKNELTVNVPPPPPPPTPPELTAPTVETRLTDSALPTIKGTWQAGVAKTLTVEVGGVTHKLGTDYDLLTDSAGHWTLKPKVALANGAYDVVATVTDGAAKSMTDVTKDELIINVPPPPPPPPAPPPPVVLAAPKVMASVSDSDHPTIKGTWPAGLAKSLTVDLDGVKHKLGTDYDLLSDSAGHWTLTPKAPLVNGTYDVVATVTDGDAQSVTDSTKGELTVKVAPPPPPPPVAQPYDCEATLARIAAVFPVRFDYDKTNLLPQFELAANQYAALLKDPRCAALKVQVAGHADDRGSEAYNQGLSENRAKTVIEALTKAGIDGARLNAVGFSKDKPLDPSHTEDARRKNRRVEFTVAK